MPLPVKPLPRSSVTINGEVVEYRSLSRAEALLLNSYRGREDEAEVYILQHGTGCTEDEARAFRDSNDTDTAGLLIDSILDLSGLTKTSEEENGKAPS